MGGRPGGADGKTPAALKAPRATTTGSSAAAPRAGREGPHRGERSAAPPRAPQTRMAEPTVSPSAEQAARRRFGARRKPRLHSTGGTRTRLVSWLRRPNLTVTSDTG